MSDFEENAPSCSNVPDASASEVDVSSQNAVGDESAAWQSSQASQVQPASAQQPQYSQPQYTQQPATAQPAADAQATHAAYPEYGRQADATQSAQAADTQSWQGDTGYSAQPAESAAQTASPNWQFANQGDTVADEPRVASPQYRQPETAQNKPRKGMKPFVWGLVGVIAGAAIVFGALFATGSLGGSSVYSGQSSNGTINITATGNDTTVSQAVAAKVLPSIVSIDVYTQQTQSYGGLFGGSQSSQGTSSETQSSLGSGVIMSSDGYILTNYHVISEGSKYIVHFDDDSEAEATVVGSDETSDLAVLKVDKTGLTPIEVADSSEVAVGDWVMTAGAPFGLTKSVSTGIVSALYRNETLQNSYGSSFYVNMIQVDAGVNPGNSGGALVNSEGKLIGICVMTASYSGDFSGVGFAIPSNYADNAYTSIVKTGKAEHPYLGVSVASVDATTKSYYGTTADSGAYVASTVEGGPAEQAGIQKGDVIVSMDGEAITTSSELIINVRSKEIGDTVELGVVRDGKQITISATLGSDAQNSDNES